VTDNLKLSLNKNFRSLWKNIYDTWTEEYAGMGISAMLAKYYTTTLVIGKSSKPKELQ